MQPPKASTTAHIYLMPGMAASPRIFEYLHLPEQFEMHWLSWIPPKKNEPLQDYAKRMCERVVHPNPILLGVSFGGVLVQEMARYVSCSKVIIVSSIKSAQELPVAMKMAKHTQIHKLLPTQWVKNIETLALFVFGDRIKKRMSLYQKYLSERDPNYLKWAIHALVHWQQQTPARGLVHIHGSQDTVFPKKHLLDPYSEIPGGHAIIINKKAWFNDNLPDLILNS